MPADLFVVLREGISDNLVDDDDDDGTVVIGKSRRPESRTVAFGSQRPRHLSVDNVDVDDDDDDDRTITPSRQQPRLTRHSSLDYAAAGAAGLCSHQLPEHVLSVLL